MEGIDKYYFTSTSTKFLVITDTDEDGTESSRGRVEKVRKKKHRKSLLSTEGIVIIIIVIVIIILC